MSKKIDVDDLITPPGEMEHRALVGRKERVQRVKPECPWCGSKDVKKISRPNVYYCLHCRQRFSVT